MKRTLSMERTVIALQLSLAGVLQQYLTDSGLVALESEVTSIILVKNDITKTCTGDDVIGCAYLGVLAHDKSEIEQWKSTTEHMGKEYKGTHNLKPPHQAPPVHVAETGENGEDDD
ncbi:hypothetical protein ANCCEY_11667 [Ancylostoma ceylanicum]|uniref:Uncharacterized protein n=1 Tax=Ancylostoma ceylanicum TaxID=53326 RepID=A0A0D6LDB7_9BILA|nr:hypothetical protein ANCCEY_11667 [Ancylostoma ceylanicum]